jgi:multisubunit Na+/H+ antiporter MnhG subunit
VSTESHDAEGNSPAAWTAVVIMLVAFAIGTTAFWFDIPVLVWISVVILVIGPIVGYFMARAGYGVNGAKFSPKSDS